MSERERTAVSMMRARGRRWHRQRRECCHAGSRDVRDGMWSVRDLQNAEMREAARETSAEARLALPGCMAADFRSGFARSVRVPRHTA